MNSIQRSNHVFLIIVLLAFALFTSCLKNDGIQTISYTPTASGCIPIDKNRVPEVEEHEYFIEAEIDGKLIRYPQINYNFTNVSNTYFPEYKETWLQAYNDSIDTKGYWKIRFHDIDIEQISLPHIVDGSHGTISWQDRRIDKVIANLNICQGIDNGCKFVISSNNSSNSIRIEKVADQIIEGTFSGRATIVRTGFTIGGDTTKCYEMSNGKFKIKYREG
ncbi:MAG: hypothetical protein P1U56_20865 [Saprospiraceae bacterium]|nr:hypothetical protein [Saprospiraceae bacterium]